MIRNIKTAEIFLLLRRTAGALLTVVCGLLALLLLVVILQLAEMLQAAHLSAAPGGPNLCREGGNLVTCHPGMLRRSFSAVKSKGTLRVFIVGSSQAMGSPYVHQNFNHISRFFPNEGGLATWLEDYLAFAMPHRRVEIINAAKGNGAKMAEHLEAMREILAKGSPDIIVVMGGNNERFDNVHVRVDGPEQREKGSAVIYPAYRRTVETMAREAAAAGVRTLFVTLPSNLRDWPPEAHSSPELEQLYRDIAAEPPAGGNGGVPDAACAKLRAGMARWRGNPVARFSMARCLEDEGKFKEAWPEYVAARDLDDSFVRVRSVQNEALRALRGPGVSVLDLEALMRGYAHDGVPGNDLFHDYCHMNLQGNKISGFEIARVVLRLEGSRVSDKELRRAPLRDLSRGALRRLYWLKAMKWTMYRFLPSSWQQLGPRGAVTAAGYQQALKDINDIDTQISLLEP